MEKHLDKNCKRISKERKKGEKIHATLNIAQCDRLYLVSKSCSSEKHYTRRYNGIKGKLEITNECVRNYGGCGVMEYRRNEARGRDVRTRKIVDVSRGRNSKLGAALVDIMEWEI